MPTTLGDLTSMLYEEFFALYGDADLAAVAAATVINDILSQASCETVAS